MQFGAKIKTSSDFLENVYTCQFEGPEYESYFWFLVLVSAKICFQY